MSKSVSIVVPTFGRPKQLKECLRAIADIDYPKSAYEVIVVDDESDCGIDQVVSRFEAELNIQYQVQSHRGPAVARNLGAAIASGNIVAFTDDDCLPDSNWLHAITAAMQSNAGVMVGGKISNHLNGNLYSTASQLLVDYLYKYYMDSPSSMRFFCANNMACDVNAFKDLGGFSEEFPCAAAEDRDLCRRWTESGLSMIYSPDALVFHGHDLTLQKYMRQHFNYGKGAFTFHARAASASRSGVRIEPFMFYSQLIAWPHRSGSTDSTALSVLMLLSQVANASGFAWEMFCSRKQPGLQHTYMLANNSTYLPTPIAKSVNPELVTCART